MQLLIPDKNYLCSFPGGKIYLKLRESQMMRNKAFGVYEYNKRKILERYINKGEVCIDIGACRGYFTFMMASKVGKSGLVVSVEPNPDNLYWLKKAIKKNNYQNIELISGAIFNKNGQLPLYLGLKSGWHSLAKNQGLGKITVKTIKLDDLVTKKDLKKIVLIKVDVEGAELEALQSGIKFLTKYKPLLMIDINDTPNKLGLYNYLKDLDYKIYKFKGLKLKSVNKEEICSNKIFEIVAKVE